MTGLFLGYTYLSAACGDNHTVCTAHGTGVPGVSGYTLMAVQGANVSGQLGTGTTVPYSFSAVLLTTRVPSNIYANQNSTLEIASLTTINYQYSSIIINAPPVITVTTTVVYANSPVQYGAQFGSITPVNYSTKTYLRAALGGSHTLGIAQ